MKGLLALVLLSSSLGLANDIQCQVKRSDLFYPTKILDFTMDSKKYETKRLPFMWHVDVECSTSRREFTCGLRDDSHFFVKGTLPANVEKFRLLASLQYPEGGISTYVTCNLPNPVSTSPDKLYQCRSRRTKDSKELGKFFLDSTRVGIVSLPLDPYLRLRCETGWTGMDKIVCGGVSPEGQYYLEALNVPFGVDFFSVQTEYNDRPSVDVTTDCESIQNVFEPEAPTAIQNVQWKSVNAPVIYGTRYGYWTGKEAIVWGDFAARGKINNPSAQTWRDMATPPNVCHQIRWTGSDLFCFAGGSVGHRYNISDDTWIPIAEPNIKRWDPCMGVVEGKILIFGGRETAGIPIAGGASLTDLEEYDPSRDEWRFINSVNTPPAGRDSCFIAGDKYQIVSWGGVDGKNRLNTGGVLDRKTGLWRSTTLVNAPYGKPDVLFNHRDTHPVFWTGKALLFWGGDIDPDTGISAGTLYFPKEDRWQPIRNPGWPGARYRPSVAWTGEKLLVWGGRARRKGNVNDGGLYDPDRDEWTRISNTGAPSPRNRAIAVSHPNGVYIFGGFDDNGTISGSRSGELKF